MAHELAWDCGAGNGQASVDLAEHFQNVIATDASAAQIAQARAHARVEYRVAPAEDSGLAPGSIDLVIVAQALHWFNLERFNAEVARVLKPGGLFAAWCYGNQEIEGAAVDALVKDFYYNVVGPHWPPERQHIVNGYRDLAMPFPPADAPAFTLRAHWDLAQLLGYFRSWSASARFTQARGFDPVAQLEPQLRSCWGDASRKRIVEWPLILRVARRPD
jgi:SAM-dependent methyltransferase